MPLINHIPKHSRPRIADWENYKLRSDGCVPWKNCPTRLTGVDSQNAEIQSTAGHIPGAKYVRDEKGKTRMVLPYKSRKVVIAEERQAPGYTEAVEKVEKLFVKGKEVLIADLVKIGNFRAVVDVWKKHRGYSFQLSRKDYDSGAGK